MPHAHRIQLSLVILGTALFANGCYQSTSVDSDAETAADAGSDDAAADAGTDDATAATDAGTDDATAATDAGPCLPDPNAVSSGERLVFADGPRLVAVDGRGSATVLYTFGATEGVAADAVFINRVVVQGGFAAASGFLVRDPQGARNVDEAVLIDLSNGQVVWKQYVAFNSSPEIFLDAHGTLAVNTWEGGGIVASAAGTRTLDTMAPVAAEAPWGEVPVRRGTAPDSSDVGWLDPATGAFRPLAHAFDPTVAAQYARPAWVAGRLVYFTREGGTSSVVSEGPSGDARLVSLGAVTAEYAPSLLSTDDAGWALVLTPAGALVRFDARSGTADPVRLDGPGGGRTPLGGSPGGAQVLSDGSVLLAWEADRVDQMFRTADLGATWAPLGEPVAWTERTYGRQMSAQWHGGTFAITTLDLIGYSYEMLPVQIVRADGAPVSLQAGYRNFVQVNLPTALSPDGRCLAYWEITGGDAFGSTATLRVSDFAGTSVSVFDATDYRDAPTWLY